MTVSRPKRNFCWCLFILSLCCLPSLTMPYLRARHSKVWTAVKKTWELPSSSHLTQSFDKYGSRLLCSSQPQPRYNSDFSYKTLPDETIYIIDASSVMFQTHHSPTRTVNARNSRFSDAFKLSLAPNMTEEQLDMACGSVVEMANSFVGFIRDVNPKYVAVVFDSGRKTFRNELFPDYKSHRKEVSVELSGWS
jgi:hypothetical protein